MRTWLISIGAAIATLAVVATNADKILTVGVKWLGPVLAPYINPQAHIAIRLDDKVAAVADIFASDPASETHALASARTRYGQEEAVLTVPANVLYKIGWQGPNIEAGAVEGVLAVKGASAFRLMRVGQGGEGVIKVTLRQTDGDATPLVATEPSAKLLISARAANAAQEPSVVVGASALPELDRAVAIVGLFETGTTDCGRRVFYVPALGSPGARTLAVGCLAFQVPGWLADVITAMDRGDAHRLDAILGDDAAMFRAYAKDWHALPSAAQLQQANERLIAAPEFWVAYQAHVLKAYERATEVARQIGLVSERGRLLVFDQLVQHGPNWIARAASTYAERYPQTAQNRPGSESARIRALGDILKTLSGGQQLVARRVDTIVTGRGSIHGVSFDLDQLGVSDAG